MSCAIPPSVPNGYPVTNIDDSGSQPTVRFTCNPGYVLSGGPNFYCNKTSHIWLGNTVCSPEKIPEGEWSFKINVYFHFRCFFFFYHFFKKEIQRTITWCMFSLLFLVIPIFKVKYDVYSYFLYGNFFYILEIKCMLSKVLLNDNLFLNAASP